jgi:hypothetical protein
VVSEQYFGADRLLVLEIAPGTTLRVRTRPDQAAGVAVDDRVGVRILPERAWVIPEPDAVGAQPYIDADAN